MAVTGAKIHEFEPSGPPYFDEEGDQMIGFYYQWLDESDDPIGRLIGPYRYQDQVERAAEKAFHRRDYKYII